MLSIDVTSVLSIAFLQKESRKPFSLPKCTTYMAIW